MGLIHFTSDRRGALVLAAGSFVMAACASRGEAPAEPMTVDARTLSVETEAPDLGALGEFNIPSGACGLILYTRSSNQTVPVFRSLNDGSGFMHIEGSLSRLQLVASAGEARASIPAFQYFDARTTDGSLVNIEAEIDWGEGFPGGAYVKSGTLSLTGADGWSRVLPVAGVAGCRG